MKTKEIINKFFETLGKDISEDSTSKSFSFLIKVFIDDMEKMKRDRNIKFDRGLIPIFKDLDKKWRNVAFKINQRHGVDIVKMDGFRTILKQYFPQAHIYYLSTLK